jgi:hypothetical protein
MNLVFKILLKEDMQQILHLDKQYNNLFNHLKLENMEEMDHLSDLNLLQINLEIQFLNF